MTSIRPAGKAGMDPKRSWYKSDPVALRVQLEKFLAHVPDEIDEAPLPIPGARVIIAPHAGYEHSGPCAAWAYKCLDLSQAKRVFVLGPSHTYTLQGCAGSTFAKYATPFGDLTVDLEMVQKVMEELEREVTPSPHVKNWMEYMPRSNEVNEHSLEMHMPYLHLRCKETFDSPVNFPKIVPLLIGDLDGKREKDVGKVLLPYIRDAENAFIVSSDFCHWGRYFYYMVYSPTNEPDDLDDLQYTELDLNGPPIHETIQMVDELAMDAVKSGNHDAFLESLRKTGNTVCGRHPIGVMMAALELLAREPDFEDQGRFSVIQYQRSSMVKKPGDSSVSYVSAYAVVRGLVETIHDATSEDSATKDSTHEATSEDSETTDSTPEATSEDSVKKDDK